MSQSQSQSPSETTAKKVRKDAGVKKDANEVCPCCEEKFVTLTRHFRYDEKKTKVKGEWVDSVPNKCQQWFIDSGKSMSEFSKEKSPAKTEIHYKEYTQRALTQLINAGVFSKFSAAQNGTVMAKIQEAIDALPSKDDE
jgi:hypothetical protein